MYTAKDFSHLLGLNGMSNLLLNNHFTLYQGYVANSNKLIDLMKTKEVGTPEFAELHRRFGWEWNGMRLHELYFENLNKENISLDDGSLKQMIEANWGSVENWQKEFVGIGTMRGIGWVILCIDKTDNKLFNVWVNEHDAGHLVGLKPILVMDVFEHAFMVDYGLKRADYINAFMNAVDWGVVENRI